MAYAAIVAGAGRAAGAAGVASVLSVAGVVGVASMVGMGNFFWMWFSVAILKSSFGEKNFGKPLSETTFGDRLSSCSEQLSTINKFGERFWGTALWSRFGN